MGAAFHDRPNMMVDDHDGPRTHNEAISPNGSAPDRTLVADAMGSLPSDYRALVHRAYYCGWTTGQIAAELGMAEGHVKTQLHYALRTLRQALREVGVAL